VINWLYYPRSRKAPDLVRSVVSVFQQVASDIDSGNTKLASNKVLAHVAPGLAALGFRVETGKQKAEKIPVPVLFGLNGRLEKSFTADAHHEVAGMVVEVEAGRGVVNNQFLKDLFQACMMTGVTEFAVAVRNQHRNDKNFDAVCRFFDTLYASNRLQLPLHGVLVIGY
jgi:hypothetical protein